MSFFNKIGGFIKPLATNLIKSVAPAATKALQGLVGKGVDSLFEMGKEKIKSVLSKLPLVGPLLSGLLDKNAPGLANLAKNFANGQIENLLGKIFGSNTQRPVFNSPVGTIVTPPVGQRGAEILRNTPPASGGAQSTGTPAGQSVSGGPTYNGSFPKYPTPPSDPRDLAAQNKFQEEMFNFQQASQNMNMFWNMMTTTAKAMKDTSDNIIRNFR